MDAAFSGIGDDLFEVDNNLKGVFTTLLGVSPINIEFIEIDSIFRKRRRALDFFEVFIFFFSPSHSVIIDT